MIEYPHGFFVLRRIVGCKSCNTLRIPCRRHRVLESVLDSLYNDNSELADWSHFLHIMYPDIILVESYYLPKKMFFETVFRKGKTINKNEEFYMVLTYLKEYNADNIEVMPRGNCII